MEKTFYEVLKARRSIRKYQSSAPARDKVRRILDAANWAPSGMGEQPWEFVVLGGEKLNALRAICKEVIDERLPATGRTEQQQAFAHWYATLGDAPLAVIEYAKKEADPGRRKMVLESLAAAFQNLVLAASFEGLGTCWMTGPLARHDKIAKLLGLGDDKEIAAVSPLGVPAEDPAPASRKDPDLTTKFKFVDC